MPPTAGTSDAGELMRDEQDILGLWEVKFRQWTWQYRFSENKTVTWRDIYNGQTGSGQWVMTDQLINIRWRGSTTKESWYRPINCLARRHS
jgi:hypothetical protein